MPASYLRIGGELISDAILVSVEVSQELNRHSWCAIECRQTEDERFCVEDAMGKPVQVTTHDQEGAEHVAFDGFVLEGELEYEVYGSYTARLKAVSRSYKLDCTPQEAYWRKKTLPDVAQALAGEDGLQADVKCGAKPPKNYVQWGETDFAFLTRIADDYHAWIRPTASGIEICDAFQAGTTVAWRKEDGLLSFRMKGRLAQPSFQGTHYNARTMTSKTMRQVQKDGAFSGASAPMTGAVQRACKARIPSGHVFTDQRAGTEQEFGEILERESVKAVAGNLVGFGISRSDQIRAGGTVQIEGDLDAQGLYGVIRVVHHWTRTGYTNEFWCTPWKQYVQHTPPAPKRMDGIVTGRVTSHNDPRKMGRLQVQYDWQESGSTGWARMVTPHAGGDRGFLFLPEIGDEVLIAFENGDPERPIIMGSLWNGVDQAPRQEFWGGDVEPNDVKRIVTKSGHRIQLSDKEGQEAIVIATPSRLKISLLEHADETGRPMLLLHAAEGDMVISAPNGRIHLQSKLISRETGDSSKAVSVSKAAPSARPSHSSDAVAKTALGGVAAHGKSPVAVVQRYNAGIVIEGPRDFVDQTKRHLDEIAKTKTGKALLASLATSKRTTTIKPSPKGMNSAIPSNWKRAVSKNKVLKGKTKTGKTYSVTGDGTGSDSTIFYNPARTQLGNEKWMKRPPAIGLAHELIHADDAAHGKLNPDMKDGVRDYERQAVGLPPYEKKAFTENRIRSEWPEPQPQRPRY